MKAVLLHIPVVYLVERQDAPRISVDSCCGPPSMVSKPPLHLFVSRHTCVTGQDVHGTVALDFRSVRDSPLDEVRVELRGNMRMCVRDCSYGLN